MTYPSGAVIRLAYDAAGPVGGLKSGTATLVAARTIVWHWDHDPFGNGAPAGSLAYNPRFPANTTTAKPASTTTECATTTPRPAATPKRLDPIELAGGVNTYAYMLMKIQFAN